MSGIWPIPASRMKAGNERRVPLSEAALDLLIGLPRMEGTINCVQVQEQKGASEQYDDVGHRVE